MYLVLVVFAAVLGFASPAPAESRENVFAKVRALLSELVAANTTNPPGNEARATAIVARRLDEAGVPYERLPLAEGRENLVARLRGDGTKRPVLILAHLDVVGTAGQSWTVEPHQVTEKDGYLYGRGVLDDLGMAAIAVETLVRLREAGTPLDRDVIVALTADEEAGSGGARHLVEHHFEKVDAAVALNEGGRLILNDDGSPKMISLQVAEKTYEDFTIMARGTTGHSSVPVGDNAIVRLSRALDRISKRRFPVRLLPVTREWLAARADRSEEPIASALRAVATAKGEPPADALALVENDPTVNATLRTTCEATLVEGGSRRNALPAEAKANVNCRILPGETVPETRQALIDAIDDPPVSVVAVRNAVATPASPLEGPDLEAIRRVLSAIYPGVPIVPAMSRGATDARAFRPKGIAVYGLNPIAATESDSRRAHGIDERVAITSLAAGTELLRALVLELAGEAP